MCRTIKESVQRISRTRSIAFVGAIVLAETVKVIVQSTHPQTLEEEEFVMSQRVIHGRRA